MNIRLNLVALQTIVRKEVVRVLRIWIQTIVPPAITMTLYFIIFGNLIGRRIGQMDGFDYMQYIAPGLIMMSVITKPTLTATLSPRSLAPSMAAISKKC